jgi:hypothetical protein
MLDWCATIVRRVRNNCVLSRVEAAGGGSCAHQSHDGIDAEETKAMHMKDLFYRLAPGAPRMLTALAAAAVVLLAVAAPAMAQEAPAIDPAAEEPAPPAEEEVPPAEEEDGASVSDESEIPAATEDPPAAEESSGAAAEATAGAAASDGKKKNERGGDFQATQSGYEASQPPEAPEPPAEPPTSTSTETPAAPTASTDTGTTTSTPTAPTTSAQPTTSTGLPVTGVEVAPIAAIGLGLLLLGAATARVARYADAVTGRSAYGARR